VLRFFPASITLLLINLDFFIMTPFDIKIILELSLIGFVFGYLPILALFTGLMKGKLTSLSIAELSIPTLSIIFTLPYYLDSYGRPIQMFGILIMFIVIVFSTRILAHGKV
jgi:hypothetical protein